MNREAMSASAQSEFGIAEEYPRPWTTVLSLRGDADLYAAPFLRERLTTAIERGARTVVIDFSDVEFVDSTAIGVLLHGHKRVRAEGGELRLVVPREEVRRIFEITLLDRILPLDRTREDALATASASGSRATG